MNPHPALKVAAPMSPMVDGWMGDDWFHFGAFRQTNFDYFTDQTTVRGEGHEIPREAYDDYTNFLRAGSAGDFAKAAGLDQLPWWRKTAEHPAYDAFWQAQALDKVMAATAAESAHHVDPGTVGPGRHVGCDSLLHRGGTERHEQQHEFPGHGSVAP